jgi:hypothetical protein
LPPYAAVNLPTSKTRKILHNDCLQNHPLEKQFQTTNFKLPVPQFNDF